MKSIKIKSERDGKEYTLAFTRMTVRRLARAGFQIEDIIKNPLDAIPMLFNGAFQAFHPKMESDELDKIWEDMPNKDELLKVLAQMYHEPIETLLDEPKEKNATWEVVG